jgi:hypothetical protein
MHWGAVIRASDDLGATWSEPDRQNVRFPEGSDDALVNIWQIRPGRASEPDVLYCGVEPAALFESRDGGESWSPVEGLLHHEHRKRWMPGAGGLKSIPGILAAAHGAKVMIVSSLAEEGAEETVAALALGAADTLPKPGTGRFNGRFSEVLMAKLRALGRAETQEPQQPAAAARSGPVAPMRAMATEPLRLVAIGGNRICVQLVGNVDRLRRLWTGGSPAASRRLRSPGGVRLALSRVLLARGERLLLLSIIAGHPGQLAGVAGASARLGEARSRRVWKQGLTSILTCSKDQREEYQ